MKVIIFKKTRYSYIFFIIESQNKLEMALLALDFQIFRMYLDDLSGSFLQL